MGAHNPQITLYLGYVKHSVWCGNLVEKSMRKAMEDGAAYLVFRREYEGHD